MAKSIHFTRQFKNLILTLGILFLLTSCEDKQKNEDLEQAFKIHNEAIKIRKEMGNLMAQLTSNTDSMFIATYSKDLGAINSSLEAWDDQIVEVPGFEHEHDHSDHSEHDHSGHDHDQDHDHGHGSEQELTPKQHLEVQQQLLENIKAIAEKINKIK